jgi:hypothetical protein
VLGARFLSLIAIVAALFVARVALATAVPASDRAEIPSGDPSDQSDEDGGDGLDLVLPPRAALPAVLPSPGRLAVVAERAPATSAFDPRIFRPPISALA